MINTFFIISSKNIYSARLLNYTIIYIYIYIYIIIIYYLLDCINKIFKFNISRATPHDHTHFAQTALSVYSMCHVNYVISHL